MIKQIRTSKSTKIIACYLSLMIFLEMVQPMVAYALTEGPSQPEFNSFTPIGTSDMVDLSSGDMNYNIPIMDVGGYPINLAYSSGVTMDQEASWVGLGWNLNVGQINRNVRGMPDDFKGDVIVTENNFKDNVTIGAVAYFNPQIIGALDNIKVGGGLEIQYNNYIGMRAMPTFSATYSISENASVGMKLTGDAENGSTITPSVSISSKKDESNKKSNLLSGTVSPSITYNSRQGLQSFNVCASGSATFVKKGYGGTNGAGASLEISFLNNTFTPCKRTSYKNTSFRMSFSTGVDIFGAHGELSMAGYASSQKLASKTQLQGSYGYEYTEFSGQYGQRDFNREFEQSTVSKNTLVLAPTNYTYDVYSIKGQGIDGMFRPVRSQIGHVFDPRVDDISGSNSMGVEMEFGNGTHGGGNERETTTTAHTGLWSTVVTPFFIEPVILNSDYQKIYYKNPSEAIADAGNIEMLTNFGQTKPITLMLDGYKNAVNAYGAKEVNQNQSLIGTPAIFTKPRRSGREVRNQVIQKFTKGEVSENGLSNFFKYNLSKNVNNPERSHHTAGYIVTDDKGGRHVFGETVYNKEKREVTMNVGDNNKAGNLAMLSNGLVAYNATDASMYNKKGRDHYFNRIITPGYAHTFLLTSELSPDYEDLTGNGPTDDDLGTYTKFIYQNKGEYNWRTPYQAFTASYNEGLKTDAMDQKGSYLYGVRQNKYLKAIVTKTHVALIDLDLRMDAFGVDGENGGGSEGTLSRMYKIKSIRLYNKSDVKFGLMSQQPQVIANAKPIKTAFFEYDYSQCPNIENNFDSENPQGGKLTLKKVYFTYRDSKMGKYTPYSFTYDNPAEAIPYNPKAYDIWGNYKPYAPDSWQASSALTTPQEFPYVDQTDRTTQDRYAAAWSLKEIKLPSGGRIKIEYESDDYQYVQDKKAMQMFKVHGVCGYDQRSTYSGTNNNELFSANATAVTDKADCVVVQVPPGYTEGTEASPVIIKKFMDGVANRTVYFNFLLNMTSSSSDFVSGYFEIDPEQQVQLHGQYLFIPMKKVNREGRLNNNNLFNPISVAGCFFAKQNLNAQVNGLEDPGGTVPANVVALGKSLVKNLADMITIFKGGNKKFMEKGCSRTFSPFKSWIRLTEPSGSKIGGGCRVKTVVMDDQWNTMLEHGDETPRYLKHYGQEYTYTLENGKSSGVATYEPNVCKENPLVMPFNNKPEKLLAQSYQETPFGSSFYPNPTVTYRRVVSKNIISPRDSEDYSKTGTIVTEHYTTYDFPTLSDLTNLDLNKNWDSNEGQLEGMLKGMLGLKISTHSDLTLSQGFSVVTNDMNGKLKKQQVFNNKKGLISSVEYKYSVNENDPRILQNVVSTLDANGDVFDREMGKSIDIVNDSKESYANTVSEGKSVNTDIIIIGAFPVTMPMIVPERSEHAKTLHTMVTTKVVHKVGILKEKIAIDVGGSVSSTKNLVWDANTGQVLLTETSNDYNDVYYTLTYPAHWYYEGMRHAATNVDFKGQMDYQGTEEGTPAKTYFTVTGGPTDISTVLKPGDELYFDKTNAEPQRTLWVCDYNATKTKVGLMNRAGQRVSTFILTGNPQRKFRVVRSGYRNNQMASMASIVLKKNPIAYDPTTLRYSIQQDALIYTPNEALNPKIINASAIKYSDSWPSQCENGLPHPTQTNINQYLYNIKGEWRPSKSYTYLTGRNASIVNNTRNAGYFTSFNPFYKRNSNQWAIDTNNWTFASEVTLFNPYGVEIENRDALGRYSAAQYGYKYKLPVAVASNTNYGQMGFDGFEDYLPFYSAMPSYLRPHFGFNQSVHNNAPVTGSTSHTGKKSIWVKPGAKVEFKRKVNGCQPE